VSINARAALAATAMMTSTLVFVLALATPRAAAPAASFDDLLPDLIARIATAVAPSDRVHLVAGGDSGVRSAVARGLAARGIQIAEAATGIPIVRVACSTNLRERVCAADVARAGAVQTLFATGAIASDIPTDVPSAVLDMRHVFSQLAPILDVALVGDRLIVLDPAALTMYQRAGSLWQKRRSQPIVSSRVWPRDIRGRLRIAGSSVEAYLPGVVCRATIDSFSVSCADERQPWPLPIENTGIAAGRNYFTTPEGLTFYASAPLDSDAGARWLLVGDRARLVLLDDARRTVDAAVGEGEDVAGVTGCGGGAFVLVSSRAASNDGRDALRLARIVDRRLVSSAPSVVLPGALTAIWPTTAPAGGTATAIVREPASERYDAIQIEVSCGR
jgi:hypothetical protein